MEGNKKTGIAGMGILSFIPPARRDVGNSFLQKNPFGSVQKRVAGEF